MKAAALDGVRMIPASLEQLLKSIASPLALVDGEGALLWANAGGQTRFKHLALMLDAITEGGELSGRQVIAGMIDQPCPGWISSHDGLLKITPMALSDGRPGGLLEWLPEAGAQKLHILQEVGRAVNSSLILEDIFDSLGEVLAQHIPYQEAVIVILDDTQNGIKIVVRISEAGDLEISGEHNTFAGYEPVIDRILRNPSSHLYGRAELADSLLFRAESASAIVVPLINKGVVIGLIAMAAAQEGGFSHYQEELLVEVSAQLAVAVENAKFYWQTQAQASREFLINQLTMSIRQSLDIDSILGTAATEIGKVTGVSRCYIRYFQPGALDADYEPEGIEELAVEPPRMEIAPRVYRYQMPGVAPVAEDAVDFERAVFHLRKDQPYNPFILNDVRDCPPTLVNQGWFEENHIRSLSVFPILVRDELVGTITLHQCDAYRVWVNEDIELLKALAEHLGVALHQAQLFLTLENQKQALEQTLDELKQAQLYLIQSEKMAVLGQFVAGIAHEVNTPLGTMIGNNATLKTCLDKLVGADAPQPELLESMQSLLDLNKLASTRIQEIVRNLRNFARLDESELKTADIHEGIDSTLLLVKSALDPRIEIERRYDEHLPPVQCYPGLLNQVFMNLLVNAGHAIQDKQEAGNGASSGGTGKITIETCYDRDSRRVTIAFHDTGKGIPEQNLVKVFDPGFTTKGVGVGTGLGLALCYRIVEKHRGCIHVKSKVNEGTSFYVEIPAQPLS